jgi:hypothetical protein
MSKTKTHDQHGLHFRQAYQARPSFLLLPTRTASLSKMTLWQAGVEAFTRAARSRQSFQQLQLRAEQERIFPQDRLNQKITSLS